MEKMEVIKSEPDSDDNEEGKGGIKMENNRDKFKMEVIKTEFNSDDEEGEGGIKRENNQDKFKMEVNKSEPNSDDEEEGRIKAEINHDKFKMDVEFSDSEDDDDEDEEDDDEEDEEGKKVQKPKEVYLPHKRLRHDEELVCDQSAYIMLREVQTGAPCLSFDIIRDELGTNRTEFPHTCYLVAGTQASKPKENCIIVMKTSNLHKTQKLKDEDDEDDDEEEEEEEESEEKKPRMDYASVAHFGCINRIRSTIAKNTILAACWSEMGRVHIWNLKSQIQAVNDMKLLAKYRQDDLAAKSKPLFTFSGHQSEGFAIDWCPTNEGMLASGDCRRNIHLWHPDETGWKVDQKPLIGHTDSVEDLQWSPNERNVLCSASVDKTIRIWDTRATGSKACMITVTKAHESDVNVIHWSRNEPFVVSGGDDGCIHVWDLRQLKSEKSVATFKHHTAPITTVEWHPTDATVFASGGEDNQIALWDLSVEKDDESTEEDIENVPPQLLFIHQGQKDIKELHWHPHIPGLIVSTALSGFNIFRTISV